MNAQPVVVPVIPSIEYTTLLRDLAGRNLEQQPVASRELAVIVREHPDVVAEAMAGYEDEVADALAGLTSLGEVITRLIMNTAAGYIYDDLVITRDQLEQEAQVDAEFAREPACS